MDKIKVLFVFGCPFNKGGTENVMINICKYIDRNVFKIDFLIFDKTEDKSDDKQFLESIGCVFYSITARGENRNRHNRELDEFFKNHQYDIVHTHMDAIGEEALRVAKKYGVSTRIAHSHNTNQLEHPKGVKEWLHRCYLILEKYLLRYYAEYYIACSPEAGRWLFGDKICSGSKYLMLGNAIETEKYQFNPMTREKKRNELELHDSTVIIHVGQFRKQKNHTKLVDVFNELYKRDNKYRMLLVGEGEEKNSIIEKVRTYGLGDSVLFLGERSDINELLCASDVFLFPSLYEGFGIALLEAQASGIACVVSDTIPQKAIVDNNVKVVGLNESETIWANVIENTIKEENSRNSKIDVFVEKGYDIRSQIKVLEEFYKGAVADAI